MSERENEQARRTVRACAACGRGTLIGMELRVPAPDTAQGYRGVRVPWCASEDCAVAMSMDPAQFVGGWRVSDETEEQAEARRERARIEWLGGERAAYVERRGPPCNACMGAGTRMYGSTATWRGGGGGQALTSDVCDRCWGSGVEGKPWPSHRAAEALRAAVDRLEGCRNFGCAVASPRGQGLNGRCRCELPPGVGPALSAARRLAAAPSVVGVEPQRYTFVSDDDGHQWLCPVERADEVQAAIDAIYEDDSLDPDAPTAGLERVEGDLLTFTDPRFG